MQEKERDLGFTVVEAAVLQRAANQRVMPGSVQVKDGIVVHIEMMGEEIGPFRVVSGEHVGEWFDEAPAPRIRNGKVWYVGRKEFSTGVSYVVDGADARPYPDITLSQEVDGVMYVVVQTNEGLFQLLQEREPIADFKEVGPSLEVDGRFYLAAKKRDQETWGIFRAEQGSCSSLQLPRMSGPIQKFEVDASGLAVVYGGDGEHGVVAFGKHYKLGEVSRIDEARFTGTGNHFRILFRSGQTWREISREGVREIPDPDAHQHAMIFNLADLQKDA